MKKLIANFFCLNLILSLTISHSIAADRKGPFQSTTNLTFHRTILNWFDNFTIGSVNTIVGAGNVTIAFIANDNVSISMSDDNRQQLLVENGSLRSGTHYSLGIFNNGGGYVNHEAGHSQQSASLGIAYLPVVGISYLIEGEHDALVEKWANAEASIRDAYSITTPFQIGYGHLDRDGKALPFVVLKFSIDERADYKGEVQLQKIYEWLKTEVLLPLAQNESYPLGFETNLLEKTVRTLYTYRFRYNQNVGLALYTDQKYLNLKLNSLDKQYIFAPLKYELEAGVAYLVNDSFKVELRVGGGAHAEYASSSDQNRTNYEEGWAVGFRAQASLNFTFFDYATLYGKYSHQRVLGKLTRDEFSFGLTNRLRTTTNGAPNSLNYVDFNLEYQYRVNKFDLNNAVTNEHYVEGSAGYRL